MTDIEALEVVKDILAPDSISHVQEIVFKFSWDGKLYPQIAKEAGYHPEYIRDVGAQLWRSLSDALGQKVTKKNVRFVLNNLDAGARGHQGNYLPRHQTEEISSTTLPFPSVALPLTSAFYIQRPAVESTAFSEICRPSGLLRLKAPSNMGKTSLVLRTLDYAQQQGMQTILINFQEADRDILSDLGRFLRWFSLNIAYQLNLEPKLDDYWDEDIGHKVSCKIYFREYILKRLRQPMVLALDEVDQLFEYPALVQEFFPMLRVWHEEGMELSIWQNLRLLLSYNSEVYVPLKISQSPFNIGLALSLPQLTLEEVQSLALRYELGWEGDEGLTAVNQLYDLVGGHPYLIQLALYWLSQTSLTLTELIKNAPTQSGIYSAHLRRHWQVLQRQPGLTLALQQMLEAKDGVQLDAMSAYRLESMGLVTLEGNIARSACKLYQLYFQSLIHV